MLLDAAKSQLLLVDMQERLMPAMTGAARATALAQLLLDAAGALGLPVTLSEQYPQGLGPTIAGLRLPLDSLTLPKTSFACHGTPELAARMADVGRPQLVIFGVETHVCVLQSAFSAQSAGFQVFVVADACASRREESKALALARMAGAGITVISAEMAVFEWLGDAQSAAFRPLSRQIRDP